MSESEEVIIDVAHLSKSFKLPHERNSSLKSTSSISKREVLRHLAHSMI